MAIAEAERLILGSEYDDYTAPDTNLAAFFRISALIYFANGCRFVVTQMEKRIRRITLERRMKMVTRALKHHPSHLP
ncbi:unnamed protein product [Eruca vesicaria subsp. sativa]|uniref:Uncharacterized protein n=1 Tax=Eruca vesicaria subsp. sativa TaxID=29727 RepID=A0ABC8L7J0_ERUVS|nr:unnamed protein product [Eruca vesicaria subsp. sativa]